MTKTGNPLNSLNLSSHVDVNWEMLTSFETGQINLRDATVKNAEKGSIWQKTNLQT